MTIAQGWGVGPGRADSPGGATTQYTLTDGDFRWFAGLVRAEAGINLGPGKRELVVSRLGGRLRTLGLRSFHEYRAFVTEHSDEIIELLDRICTNETRFFREPHHFEFLASKVVPRMAAGGPRRVRIWSAGCSTGEEPYSLAMLLVDLLPASAGWRVGILASDLSTRVLAQATKAVWPLSRASEIPEHLLRAHMLRGTGPEEGRMKAGRAIRELLTFGRINLHGPVWPTGRFDVIFCRNVLIYFSPEDRFRVLRRLREHLAPNGYLFLGHAETLLGVDAGFRSVAPTVYAACEHR